MDLVRMKQTQLNLPNRMLPFALVLLLMREMSELVYLVNWFVYPLYLNTRNHPLVLDTLCAVLYSYYVTYHSNTGDCA